jgi:hypothetical protein
VVKRSFSTTGARWAVIAERDESEVLTEYYREYEGDLFEKLLAELGRTPLNGIEGAFADPPGATPGAAQVDLQEFRRADHGRTFFTTGVATRTGLSAYVPGRFGYLLHATPTDQIYGHRWPTTRWLGWQFTDLVDDVVQRLHRFDVLPFDQGSVRFGIYATTPGGMRLAISKLLDRGVELRQIVALFQPGYYSVSVELDYMGDEVRTTWFDAEGRPLVVSVGPHPTLETVLLKLS